MEDKIFIDSDKKSKVKRVTPIDYSSDNIGTLKLLAITNAKDFIKQATLCDEKISVRRMKEIKVRKKNVKSGLLHDKLSEYANKSIRVKKLYEFNDKWRKKFKIR